MRLNKFTEFGRKIIAVGRNYVDHISEMKAEMPESPVLFLKPPTAYVTEGSPIKIPRGCKELAHEVELGVVISRKASKIPESEALDSIGGYVISIDLTARDWQRYAKERSLPWALSKGFDGSCPVSSLVPKQRLDEKQLSVDDLQIWLKVNGEIRQNASTKLMMYSVPFLVSHVSQYFTLEPGDLVLTGTPSGVGSLKHGDRVEIGLADIVTASFDVHDENNDK